MSQYNPSEKTPLQKFIENKVTNGLGYSLDEKIIREDRDSKRLNTHLCVLDIIVMLSENPYEFKP